MYHPIENPNGGSSSLFWLPVDHNNRTASNRAVLQTLSNQYSIFAYVVEGIEVLPLLRTGDLIVSTTVMSEDEDSAMVGEDGSKQERPDSRNVSKEKTSEPWRLIEANAEDDQLN